MPSMADPVKLLLFHGGQMWSWRQAAEERLRDMRQSSSLLQQHLDEGTPEPVDVLRRLHNDSQLMIIASWLARQSASDVAKALQELGKNAEADDIHAAIADFDSQQPDLKVLRHRIEHIDEYLRGKGLITLPDAGSVGWVGHSAEELEYEVAGIHFLPGEVVRAVQQLVDASEQFVEQANVPMPTDIGRTDGEDGGAS